MPKETLSPEEFDRQLEESVRAIDKKIKSEEQFRRALWALEVLKQEEKIKPETTFAELMQIVEVRIKEGRDELSEITKHTEGIIKSPATDEVNIEFQKVAREDVAKSERILAYMEAVLSALTTLKYEGRDSETPFSQIQDRLKGELEILETAVDRSEESQRHSMN